MPYGMLFPRSAWVLAKSALHCGSAGEHPAETDRRSQISQTFGKRDAVSQLYVL